MTKIRIGRPTGSKTNSEGLRAFKAVAKEELLRLYGEGRTTREIGAIYGVSRTAADNRFKALGIQRRWHDETAKFKNAKMSIPLSNLQRQMLLGSILGDACLHEYDYTTKRFGIRKYLKVQFAQGEAQLPYLSHKRDIMLSGREKLPKTCVSKLDQRPEGSNLGLPVWQFAFSHTPTLRALVDELGMKNSEGVTCVSDKWVGALDATSVAYWFADDGNLLTYPKDGTWRLTFHTDAYTGEELQRLLEFVRSFCAPSARLHEKREGQYAIEAYRREEVETLIKKIAPFTPECMKHKLKLP